MLKLILISLSLVLVTGCSISPKKVTLSPKKVTPPKAKKMTHKMFQSVPKEKAVLLQKGKNKDSCYICGMNLVKFYKTSHAANENGTTHQYCSIHCLTKDIERGAELENPKVVDVSSLKFIPVTEAYYVVGSRKPATMSRVSKYAFKSLNDAESFQSLYGGKIVDFYSAIQFSKRDFY